MDAAALEAIACRYLPSRGHYYYARTKLAIDPLHAAVAAALDGTDAPLLDLGCGLGLLPHFCRVRGLAFEYLGVDNDAGKITRARAAAARGGLANVRFEVLDLAQGFPDYRGSVAILDLLQYLPPARVATVLAQAADCVTASGRLVIRTGLQDASWRIRVARAGDVLARMLRWMNSPPREYPTRALLDAVLAAHGLEAEFMTLRGNMPLNNWLIVARRSAA